MAIRHYDLTKTLEQKIKGQIAKADPLGRFGAEAPVDKREQRKRDQELGLIPFACKLPSTLVEQLREQSVGRSDGINGLVAELLGKALSK